MPAFENSKGPLSVVSGSAKGVESMKRLYVMSKHFGLKMTPYLLHLIDVAWASFMAEHGDKASVELVMMVEDVDGGTEPLSTYKPNKGK